MTTFPVKNALFALVVMFGSLAYGQVAPPQATPVAPPVAPTFVAPAAPVKQPIGLAGGLDERCQTGLNVRYNMNADKSFGTNDPAESDSLSKVSLCMGYIAGWAQSMSGTFILADGSLWRVGISESINPVQLAADLHEFIKKNPDRKSVV